jgi:septal ring factor EnvC (AmiA/AmiB activator)
MIKKYWMKLTAFMLGLFGLIWIISKIFTKNKLEKSKEKIEDNEKKISKSEGKSEVIETQKKRVKKEISNIKQEIKKTEANKNRKPGRPKKSTNKAKQNILDKTKSRKK